MLKYLVLYINIFFSIYKPLYITFKHVNSNNHEVICMAPPPGNGHSKINDNSETLNEECKITSKTITNNNGSTTHIISATFNKKETVDKNGKLIRQTDTTTANFQKVKDIFFNTEKNISKN